MYHAKRYTATNQGDYYTQQPLNLPLGLISQAPKPNKHLSYLTFVLPYEAYPADTYKRYLLNALIVVSMTGDSKLLLNET